MGKLDFKGLNEYSLSNIDSVLHHYLPNGKHEGHEYKPLNPRRADNKSGSFSINTNTGVWADFADSEAKGQDVISLVAYVTNKPQGEAFKELSDLLNYSNRVAPKASESATNARRNGEEWLRVAPVPPEFVKRCFKKHLKHGLPTFTWEYRDSNNQLILKVLRFDKQIDGKREKVFAPLALYRNRDTGEIKWRWSMPKVNRPLYGLHELAKRPKATVVLAEGEKAADAAKALFPSCVCMTWPNGSKSISKTDFTPLTKRNVIIWPDNDNAGIKCAKELKNLLTALDAASIRIINLESLAKTPLSESEGDPLFGNDCTWPDKADAADAIELGWGDVHLEALKKSGDLFLKEAVTHAPSDINPNVPQGFKLTANGVEAFYKSDDKGNEIYKRICAPLELLALTRDASGSGQDWGVLVRFKDYDGQEKRLNIPKRLFATDGGSDIRKQLLSEGLHIEPRSQEKGKLIDYLNCPDITNRVGLVKKLGWHKNAFILPDQTIGETVSPLVYDNENARDCKLKATGSISEWQREIAAYCEGNPLLTLAVSLAFTGPLVSLMGLSENVGFHFYGDSSLGKSTLMNVSCSVYGKPSEFKGSWRTTDNALEDTAALHSDMLLALDELNEANPLTIEGIIYMVGNGKGKNRSGPDYAKKKTQRWNLAFLSNGEKTIDDYLGSIGKSVNGGVHMRFLSLPASQHDDEALKKRNGIYTNTHNFINGAALSDHLNKACEKYHGEPFLEFIKQLTSTDLGELIKVHHAEIATYRERVLGNDAGGQAVRAFQKFALVGLAGELASTFGITGWSEGNSIKSAISLFRMWVDIRGGTGNVEEIQLLNHLAKQIKLYGEKHFKRWDRSGAKDPMVIDEHVPSKLEMWGYREQITIRHPDKDATTDHMYYVYKDIFMDVMCKGFDGKRAARLLRDLDVSILRPSELERKKLNTSEALPNAGGKSQQVIKFKASSLFEAVDRMTLSDSDQDEAEQAKSA
ncbi:hypothetical protein A6K25_15180 [Alteromonas stellipolaris]|uniref:DUF927 domain-containing protein n=1 Tax=Alteromonas stellipolaris TaxID=233316 RepID=UPI0007B44C07|nr:DUF927 domain-containing protein [Alteromonas stellipolaris]ANB22494.1 hypothetical protein A6K25_15180 [Alteromonas stellipolaris]